MKRFFFLASFPTPKNLVVLYLKRGIDLDEKSQFAIEVKYKEFSGRIKHEKSK
ncbi:MAG TPA: hypothetical protein VMW72_01515 [Sedimentisphaerales bacterium]|nr:hypothetical protein [Sedimentisphaerales bacterium]